MSDRDAGLIIGWVFALFMAAVALGIWLSWQGIKLLARLVKYTWQYLRTLA